ncbi:outer membrane protein OmpA-like peptidoglycan-associated protein [Murinocardiopsis flavida]|uniref:Outer membrane protein OmpA-like peptidoglycan-associated protein n=1 Tax=Murinocardiopsis flavida TaxID=645275 RepID=A0A2P8DV13_9ACTN|nr:OmpA family protein [Murinocardiopsis flavida]PSL01041.1 outer membrane protein OmpA-like peptidoglycan-associated protein [Murinocardiopsis flavida]
MSRSADVVGLAAAAAAVLLLAPVPAAADAEPGPVAEAPILDLSLPVNGISAPVEDLTYATENEDGSLTDAENAKERTVTLAADVLFDFDKATLSGKAETALAEAAGILEEHAGGKTVDIVGYTDAKGDDAYNTKLSEDRAETVRAELEPLVSGTEVKFRTAGKGSADPVAPNEVDGEDNPKGREKNRRVEIRFPR